MFPFSSANSAARHSTARSEELLFSFPRSFPPPSFLPPLLTSSDPPTLLSCSSNFTTQPSSNLVSSTAEAFKDLPRLFSFSRLISLLCTFSATEIHARLVIERETKSLLLLEFNRQNTRYQIGAKQSFS